MAGHSKWANIRIRKGAQDAKRGRAFTKVARELMIAAKVGGGDPSMNPRLRLAIQKAKDVNMPRETVERAIKKGTGEIEAEQLEEIVYEGYGPHGVALVIEAMTDNRNRTVGEIRAVLGKRGGNLGESGCTTWMFETKGLAVVAKEGTDEEALMSAVVDAGADDFREAGDTFEIVCAPDAFMDVRAAIEALGIEPISAEITRIPTVLVPVEGDKARAILRVYEELEDHEDVQKVHANFDIADHVLEEIAAGG